MERRADELLDAITRTQSRADPFPLYRGLHGLGLVEQTDGSFLVGDYHTW